MTDREKQKALSLYRLTQAEESLDETRYLLAGGKSLRSVINWVYYGMFYSILGLLIYEPYASSKHSGVLSYFNKRFIGDGIFPEQMGRTVHKAFDLRQRGDYREYQEIEPDQVGPLLEQADAFVRAVRQYLEKHLFIEERMRIDLHLEGMLAGINRLHDRVNAMVTFPLPAIPDRIAPSIWRICETAAG